MRLALPSLAIGLAIGGGVGFLIGQGSTSAVRDMGPDVERETTLRRDGRSETESPALPAVSAPAPPSNLRLDDGIESAARAAGVAVGARVAATLEGDASAAWTASVEGTVVGPHGAPLIGVTVAAEAGEWSRASAAFAESTNSVGRAYAGPDSIEDSLTDRAEDLLRSRRGLRTATTDADGAFVLEGLPPGKCSLRAYADGFVFDRVDVYAGETVRLKGRPVGVFLLDVRLPDGSAAENAVVQVIAENRSRSYEWTRVEPEVRLEERSANLLVLAGDVEQLDWRTYSSDYASEQVRIELARDGEGPHVIQLHARSPLHVFVEDESGLEPSLSAWVKVIPTARAAADLDSALQDARGLVRGRSAAFMAPDLSEGTYVVAVGRGPGAPEVTDAVAVVSGGTEHRVVLGAVDLDRFLVARCVGPDGRPLEDVRFTSVILRGPGSWSESPRSIERGPGQYWLTFGPEVARKRETDGTSLLLEANSTSFGRVERELGPDAREVLFQFRTACTLAVHVDGQLSPGLTVSADPIEEDPKGGEAEGFSFTKERLPVGEDGRVELTGLQPGRHRVSLFKDSDRWDWMPPIQSQEVTVSANGTDVRFVAPSFHIVRIYAPDVEPGTTLALRKKDEVSAMVNPNSYGELGGDHRVVLTDVPAGDYVLSSWGSVEWSQDVTVPCGEVLFEPEDVTAFEATWIEPGKLAAEAGLQVGDRVTAIDGESFDGSTFFSRVQLGLGGGETITLSVQRGSTTVELSVGPLEGGDNAGSAMGVRWRPRAH
ncbi:MAG: PDZ domain-containing protein [Planctomycetota bacterium]